MISDDERREVARRLREYSGGRKAFHLGRLCAACGIDKSRLMSRTTDADAEAWAHLADLIEPSGHECVPGECPLNVRHDNDRIDQERLLAIATMMAADSVRSAKQGSSVSPVYILHAARNIAEACGETFGSIRNRELAKWGTSIVPKETIVDREALLALADEMGHPIKQAVWNQTAGVRREHIMAEYARRIREACGEVSDAGAQG